MLKSTKKLNKFSYLAPLKLKLKGREASIDRKWATIIITTLLFLQKF